MNATHPDLVGVDEASFDKAVEQAFQLALSTSMQIHKEGYNHYKKNNNILSEEDCHAERQASVNNPKTLFPRHASQNITHRYVADQSKIQSENTRQTDCSQSKTNHQTGCLKQNKDCETSLGYSPEVETPYVREEIPTVQRLKSSPLQLPSVREEIPTVQRLKSSPLQLPPVREEIPTVQRLKSLPLQLIQRQSGLENTGDNLQRNILEADDCSHHNISQADPSSIISLRKQSSRPASHTSSPVIEKQSSLQVAKTSMVSSGNLSERQDAHPLITSLLWKPSVTHADQKHHQAYHHTLSYSYIKSSSVTHRQSLSPTARQSNIQVPEQHLQHGREMLKPLLTSSVLSEKASNPDRCEAGKMVDQHDMTDQVMSNVSKPCKNTNINDKPSFYSRLIDLFGSSPRKDRRPSDRRAVVLVSDVRKCQEYGGKRKVLTLVPGEETEITVKTEPPSRSSSPSSTVTSPSSETICQQYGGKQNALTSIPDKESEIFSVKAAQPSSRSSSPSHVLEISCIDLTNDTQDENELMPAEKKMINEKKSKLSNHKRKVKEKPEDRKVRRKHRVDDDDYMENEMKRLKQQKGEEHKQKKDKKMNVEKSSQQRWNVHQDYCEDEVEPPTRGCRQYYADYKVKTHRPTRGYRKDYSEDAVVPRTRMGRQNYSESEVEALTQVCSRKKRKPDGSDRSVGNNHKRLFNSQAKVEDPGKEFEKENKNAKRRSDNYQKLWVRHIQNEGDRRVVVSGDEDVSEQRDVKSNKERKAMCSISRRDINKNTIINDSKIPEIKRTKTRCVSLPTYDFDHCDIANLSFQKVTQNNSVDITNCNTKTAKSTQALQTLSSFDRMPQPVSALFSKNVKCLSKNGGSLRGLGKLFGPSDQIEGEWNTIVAEGQP